MGCAPTPLDRSMGEPDPYTAESMREYADEVALRALDQRELAFKQRRTQIILVSTNVIITALIALKTFGII